MKKIFAYFGYVLTVALVGALTACTPKEIIDADSGALGIKTFFPTKVVTNQPMTINGTGFGDVREVVFPGGVTVTDIEHVGNGMIRVTTPAGVSAGKLIVRSTTEEAESRQDLTLGNTVISGFSKMDGEDITGGELLTVYGTDLEFISAVELLDNEGNPVILQDEDFYRKGTSTVVIALPKKVFEGTWIGKLYTFDGKVFNLPELNYKPGGGGHWETVKKILWQNEDGSAISWSGKYRFALEGHDGASECIAEFPQAVWDLLLSETFYMDITSTDPQVRVTNGWWDTSWNVGDIQPGNELLTDNGDGSWSVEINISGDQTFVGTLLEKHLLFTGDRYTPVCIYVWEDVWVEGGEGHMETVKTSIWKNEDGSAVSWSSKYRFALEGHDGASECIAEIPADIWNRMLTETFYLDVTSSDPQIRITTGWWDPNFNAGDYQPGNEALTDNGDGTWTLAVNLTGDQNFIDNLLEKHLLFTGDRFTPIELYFLDEQWVDGGDDTPKLDIFWENELGKKVAWSGDYRFGLEGNDGNNECIATFPQDIWDKIKSTTFYLELTPNADWYNVRVTNGWWDVSWNVGDIGAGNERMIPYGEEGNFIIAVNISEDSAFLGTVDQKHILFTGEGYTPVKLFFSDKDLTGGGAGGNTPGGGDNPGGGDTPGGGDDDTPIQTEGTVIWDTKTVFDSWSATILIDPEKFAGVQEGDKVRVYIKDKTDDYNPVFKHEDWSDWSEFVREEGDGFFEAVVPAAAIDELKTKGLRFQGVGFTIAAVTLIPAVPPIEAEGTVIWDTETPFDSWSATILIGPEKFADVQEGDIVRVYYRNKTDDYNPVFKHEDWSDWSEFAKQEGDGYFQAAVPAAAIDELKTKGLRFQGVGFTLAVVSLIRPLPGTPIYETETVFDSWSATLVVEPDKFADVKAGDIVRVYLKEKTADFNPVFKHVSDWSDWPEFVKEEAADYFQAAVPESAIDELKSAGLRFQGVGFTVKQVNLIQ